MGELYNCSPDNISLQSNNIYNNLELDRNSTTEDFSVVQKEDKREVTRKIKYYNLDAVISVGYKVNSDKATEFRIWVTKILEDVSKISYEIACDKALTEFEKYRIKQDKLYKSDFDNFLNETKMIEEW